MTQLTLVRHGETEWNITRRFQGSTNLELNENGKQQAECLAGRLADESFDHIYSSDLTRVQQTARIALGDRFQQVTLDKRLREIHFGKFEGMTYAEIQAQYPRELAQWEADRNSGVMETERADDIIARVQHFLDDMRARHNESQRVLVIGHGGVIALMLSLALSMPPSKWWQLRMDNAAIARINLYDEGASLLAFNDYHHLPPELVR